MTRHLKPNIADIAAEICRRDTETTAQVDRNRMNLIYGLTFLGCGYPLTIAAVRELLKSFLTDEEKGQGIAFAQELMSRAGETKP